MGLNYNYMQQTNIFAEIELLKLAFEIYKHNYANEPANRHQSIAQIYRNLKDLISEVQPETQLHDFCNINIVDNFPCVVIAPIYCFSLQENGLIAAITKVLIIEEDIPEIANKGVYVQEVYVNTVNADYKAIFEFIGIPKNAIIKLPYVGDKDLYNALCDYPIEFYKPVENIVSLETMLTMSQIKCKGLNVVSEIGNLSRNLLNELKDDNFGACLQSLAWLGIIEMNIKVSVYSENELLKSQTIKQNL